MRILHITDFHYTKESTLEVKVVNSIIDTIIKEKIKIDFVFFTGDLVQAGNSVEIFQYACDALFNKISDKLNISKESIIFCPGNHDINREKIHSAAKSYFDTQITSNEKLNDFYKNKTDSMFIDSFKPSENYQSFLKSYHEDNAINIHKDLYSIYYRTNNEDGQKIGIVCLNSAWVSSIDKTTDKTDKTNDDKGNLLIPTSALNDIKTYMSGVSKKIVLIHHPLYFLKEFNFYEVENFIHNEFDLMFSGHVHKMSSISSHSGTNGIFEHVAKASLSSVGNLGCSLIELDDVEENLIRVKEITYIEDDNLCHIGAEIRHTIPCGIEKAKKIAFRRKIFEKISLEKENANKLLLLKGDEEKKDFLSLYNHPVLKNNSEDSAIRVNSSLITIEDLASGNNYIILGKDKCGKTTLLKRIQLYCLINYSKLCKIPFYIDAKEYESKIDSNFDLSQNIREYYGINKEKVKEILENSDFILLIDNYIPILGFAVYLNDFLLKNPHVSYIICSENNITRSVDKFHVGETKSEKLFFHDLRRQEIVTYTEKRLAINQSKDAVQDKIFQLCKQLELPLNYWTVSLLILIYNKSSNNYFRNLFSILDVCVDEIFEKKQLLIAQSRISFEQLKTICAELAKYLFIEHESTVYSASYSDILSFINKITIENDRISTNATDIFNYFMACGILKQKSDIDLYVFRLNGFFEYFLAYQMTKDSEFTNEILSDSSKYLGFKNELEIYSGFKRDDFNFLKKIYHITQKKVDPIFSIYAKNKDIELSNNIKTSSQIEDFCKQISIQKALSANEKAELEDSIDELKINSDVHLVEKFSPTEMNPEILERYISILSRIFRNSDEIRTYKDELVDIFNEIIDYYCDFGFYIVDNFSMLATNKLKKAPETIGDSQEFELLRFMSNFTPLIAQTFLYDGIGHYNMERMIKNKITELEIDVNNNQYKLFMLYFLLLDIDIKTNKDYIQIAISNIKIPILKYLIIIKLNYYLAFKATSDKTLQNELENKIKQAQFNVNNRLDPKGIQKGIYKIKKQSQINKNKI